MIQRTEIQAAVEAELLTLFPALEGQLYRGTTPKDFARPAAMTLIREDTMRCRTRSTVSRSAKVLVTLFCPVDEYHNSDADTLSAMSDTVMEHFSAPCLAVGDRFLDIDTVTANVQLDYAELTIPLSWDDDRRLDAQTAELMRTLHLSVTNKND